MPCTSRQNIKFVPVSHSFALFHNGKVLTELMSCHEMLIMASAQP
uniref:Uncharacterized protein n=1 Tax=Arundo donax TaxID=35708 RepID=A0A0A9B9V0_ARUDO